MCNIGDMEDTGEFTLSIDTQPNAHEIIDDLKPDDIVLMVCDNGRTRSKYAARAIHANGYNSRTLGIKDFGLSTQEKIDAIKSATVIVALAPDVLSMTKRFIQDNVSFHEAEDTLKHVIGVEVPERIHWALNNPTNKKRHGEAINELNEILETTGFVKKEEISHLN